MSTKTSIKRVALIAVSALGFGLMSVVPAKAAATIAYTTMQDTANGKQIVGGLATVTVTPDAATDYQVKVTGGTVIKMTLTDADDDSKLNGVITPAGAGSQVLNGDNKTVQYEATDAADTLAIQVTSATVGDVVVSVTPYDANGVLGTAVSKTIGFIAATTLDLASIQVSTLPADDAGAKCTVANKADALHNSINYQDSDDVANGGDPEDIDLCVIAFNGLGAAKTGVDITVLGNGKGNIGGNVAASSLADAQGIQVFETQGNGLSGVGEWKVTVTDGVNTYSSTVKITYYGELKTLTLTNLKYALDDGDANIDAFNVSALDENGNPVPLDLTNDNEFIVDSDISSAAVMDAAGEEDAEGALTVSNDGTVSALGVQTKAIMDWDPAATEFEKVTFQAVVTNGDGVKVTSNTITVYTTDDLADAVTITAADGLAGASQTLNATATYLGYPIADGENITFGTSGGFLSTTTAAVSNGKATLTMYNSAIAGDYTVSAKVGTVEGTAKFVVTGGIGNAVDASTEAAVEATDAANQAYEAAVVATETAEAAVAAAEDAKAAAEAATAAVEALATQVSTMMAELKAQVTALAKTVAKILKKI